MDCAKTTPVSIQQLKKVCSTCSLRELCLPMGLSPEEIEQLDHLVYTRKRVKRGESLYRAGDPFTSLNAVRTGFFKSTVVLEDGRDQVTGFHMPGEIMGLDGIGTDRHTVSTIALEDSEVCIIPYSRLEELSHKVRSLQSQFHKMMSREIVRDQGVMMLLGTMRAEERLAAFLLNLSQRFGARGYSPTEFNLRMTREEIGSYLGLKLETISRAFSKFQEQGLITVRQKHVRIEDLKGLRRLLGREC
ncbi:MAG: fumarate/nitrate reduction transcriptional regulator Fnr [Burkholderiales bacterium]|nr:fumarate/nitrate reduction transcriptional regulator Fnr [Burkholderiales bacterium]